MVLKAHRFMCTVGIGLLVLGGMAGPAHAQARGGHGHRQGNPQPAPEKTPQDAPPAPPPLEKPQGPFLERGAILCSSRDDLVGFQTASAARAKTETPGPAPDCRTIFQQTGIRIVDRDGPSRTQVSLADGTGQTGWTNAYLPPEK